MTTRSTTHYDVLGVERTSSTVDIRKAYLTLARQHHPDKNGGESTAAFQRLSHAYDVLSDSKKRRAYDRALDEAEAEALEIARQEAEAAAVAAAAAERTRERERQRRCEREQRHAARMRNASFDMSARQAAERGRTDAFRDSALDDMFSYMGMPFRSQAQAAPRYMPRTPDSAWPFQHRGPFGSPFDSMFGSLLPDMPAMRQHNDFMRTAFSHHAAQHDAMSGLMDHHHNMMDQMEHRHLDDHRRHMERIDRMDHHMPAAPQQTHHYEREYVITDKSGNARGWRYEARWSARI